MSSATESRSVALYVHIPFCRARCTYCDFNTYAGLERAIPAYAEALAEEIRSWGRYWRPLRSSTIYFGGGTPSLLPLGLVSKVVTAIQETFDLTQCQEFTFEANPGTITRAYLRGLRAIGVDRLSLGVQSAHDDELRMLGRIHRWSDVLGAARSARAAGFQNLSFDLLFGLPGQSQGRWERTLHKILELEPAHLSLYDLTLETGTPLAESVRRGELGPADDQIAASMVERAETLLGIAGFFHYEISSWATIEPPDTLAGARWWPDLARAEHVPRSSEEVSDRVCLHNLTYWRNQHWIGFGAGAHSWMPLSFIRQPSTLLLDSQVGERWANVDHPEHYIATIRDDGCPQRLRRDIEAIDVQLAMGETMMLGLRLAEGVSTGRFRARFGISLAEAFGEELDDLRNLGLLTWDGTVARLTERGRLLGNRVFERFI